MMEQTEAERLGADVGGEFVRGLDAMAWADGGKALKEWAVRFAEALSPLAEAIRSIASAWAVMAAHPKPHRWAHRRNPFAGHKRWPGRRQRR